MVPTIKIHHDHRSKSCCQYSACPFMLCAFMYQLINFAKMLVQLGSFQPVPGVSPTPLDLCVTDRSLCCSSGLKTACVCSFSARAWWLQTRASAYSGGSSGRAASVTWLALLIWQSGLGSTTFFFFFFFRGHRSKAWECSLSTSDIKSNT